MPQNVSFSEIETRTTCEQAPPLDGHEEGNTGFFGTLVA